MTIEVGDSKKAPTAKIEKINDHKIKLLVILILHAEMLLNIMCFFLDLSALFFVNVGPNLNKLFKQDICNMFLLVC